MVLVGLIFSISNSIFVFSLLTIDLVQLFFLDIFYFHMKIKFIVLVYVPDWLNQYFYVLVK